MRTKIVAGNWKMNLNFQEAINLVESLNQYTNENNIDENVKIVVAPSFPFISSIIEKSEVKIQVAAQNCSAQTSGAFTGDSSIVQLESIGCNMVILGHSERRSLYNESNQLLKAKVDLALEHQTKIIFCCGESLELRENGQLYEFVKAQLAESIFHLTAAQFEDIVIAYEPIWAIGTGKTASPEQAQEMHKFIRKAIAENYNESVAENTSILYGGSVKPANAKELFSQADIDGGLVGGASLKAESFTKIIEAAC